MRKKNRQYLQLAFNHNFSDFKQLISHVPPQDNVMIEAGTPFLKRYGINVIPKMRQFLVRKNCG